jgi:predicted dinucleotide-binding enzyme
MKIAVMGTGGVGGYYGGLLAQSGQDVTFVVRRKPDGAHLAAIREKGLQVKSVHGDFVVAPAQATDNPAEVGPVDLILFTTKTYHTDEAAQAVKPMVGKGTIVAGRRGFRRRLKRRASSANTASSAASRWVNSTARRRRASTRSLTRSRPPARRWN